MGWIGVNGEHGLWIEGRKVRQTKAITEQVTHCAAGREVVAQCVTSRTRKQTSVRTWVWMKWRQTWERGCTPYRRRLLMALPAPRRHRGLFIALLKEVIDEGGEVGDAITDGASIARYLEMLSERSGAVSRLISTVRFRIQKVGGFFRDTLRTFARRVSRGSWISLPASLTPVLTDVDGTWQRAGRGAGGGLASGAARRCCRRSTASPGRATGRIIWREPRNRPIDTKPDGHASGQGRAFRWRPSPLVHRSTPSPPRPVAAVKK